MDDHLPPAWPPPWYAVLSGVLFIVAVSAIPQGQWAVAVLAFTLAVVAAFTRRLTRHH